MAEDARAPNLARVGHGKGVPMGGILSGPAAGQPPSFLIGALRDPDGANLDRIQVIKGWRDAAGSLHEQVFDAALSGGRKVGRNGQAKPVGSTVDVANGSYSHTIGARQLLVSWQDPDFDAAELAFYIRARERDSDTALACP